MELCADDFEDATNKPRETLKAKLNKFRLTKEKLEAVIVAGDIDGVPETTTVDELMNKVYSDHGCDIEKTAQFLLSVAARRRINEVAHSFVPFDKF